MLIPPMGCVFMDYYQSDSHSSVPLLARYLLSIPPSFKYPATRTTKHQLNQVRVARFARLAARATLLAGLLALLWIASPQAWSQTIKWSFTANHEANGSPAIGVDGTIYFGSTDGRLYAVQADPGSASGSQLRWYFQTEG